MEKRGCQVVEKYLKFKMFTEIYLPAIIFGVIVLFIFIMVLMAIVEGHKIDKIKKYMIDNGYEYYLRDVASFGDKVWWSYRKDNVRIDEEDLYKMSLREIKKKY